MDLAGWLVAAAAIGSAIGMCAAGSSLLRTHRRGGAGGFGGLGSGLDAVWRPSTEEAHAQWESEVRLPAPAPLAGDKGRIESGRIVIRMP